MNKSKEIPKRDEVDSIYKWHITDLYPSTEDWEKQFAETSKKLPELDKYKNTFAADGKKLADCLELFSVISSAVERLYVYANMSLHQDSTNTFFQELSLKAEMLMVKLSSVTSFISPEIISLPQDIIDKYMAEYPALKTYSQFIHDITRTREHTLSAESEELIAKTHEISGSPQDIFAMINDADIEFPMIKDENGEEVRLTKGRYTTFLENKNRDVRKEAFTALYKTYSAQKNTLASTFYSNAKSDSFYAKVRKYPSSLALALSHNNIPEEVYTNLIETVHKNIGLLHRYVKLRKKILGVDELHMYDLYAPLVPDMDKEFSYEESKEIILKGLEPMGSDYISALKEGFEGGWIDVYENQGKRGGAYSWGTYSAHPFVLLNHNDNINSMFTIAHEMGHALHSYYTWKTQPYVYSDHKIFVAEVASTVNEALLMQYLLKTTEDKDFKKYLINYFMEQFRGTLFRQTMFAEFEMITHQMVDNDQPLSYENLNKIYRDLNKFYFGYDIVVDEDIDIEWARIPHFYNAFYVYQYATGYSAAIHLSEKILAEGTPAVEKYIDFLSKGTSEYPIDLLKGAGVDMTQKEPIENAMKVFESLLDQMENM